jgi:hypothetical protein
MEPTDGVLLHKTHCIPDTNVVYLHGIQGDCQEKKADSGVGMFVRGITESSENETGRW